jgi:acyl carrier protein
VNEQQVRTVIEEVLHGIAPEATLDGIDPDEMLQEELDLDSMDFLNLVVGIHQRTGVEIPERDYPMVSSLSGCVAYVAARA